MNPEAFSEWFETKTSSLDGWGRCVVDTIQKRVLDDVGSERSIAFFKIPPKHRVKDLSSALKKLYEKKYTDPQKEMTDLVGCRFVVLLSTDIQIVERCLVDFSGWSSSRERHYLDEAKSKPGEFDYQSVHYLVVCPSDFIYQGIQISEGTICEVQIRSVLQHAYAELVHDNIYKPNGYVPPAAKRLVARSMALMEATDEMFCQVVRELQSVNKSNEAWCKFLDAEYKNITGIDFKSTSDDGTLTILDTFRDVLLEVSSELVKAMIATAFYRDIIVARTTEEIFQKPVCILVFWLAKNKFQDLKDRWPLHSYSNGVAEICAAIGKKWN